MLASYPLSPAKKGKVEPVPSVSKSSRKRLDLGQPYRGRKMRGRIDFSRVIANHI